MPTIRPSENARRADRWACWATATARQPLPGNIRSCKPRGPITLAVRQIKGTQIDAFARDVQAALDSLKGVLPERPADRADAQRSRRRSREKVRQFDQNLIEAVVIVVLVAMLFMEWRSALLVAVSIPLTVRHDAGHLPTAGHRPAAGVDRRHDHRPGPAGRRSGGGRRRDQPRVGPRAAPRRGRLAGAAETGPGHPLRHRDQLRGVPAAAAGAGQDGRVHLLAAGGGHGLAWSAAASSR